MYINIALYATLAGFKHYTLQIVDEISYNIFYGQVTAVFRYMRRGGIVMRVLECNPSYTLAMRPGGSYDWNGKAQWR